MALTSPTNYPSSAPTHSLSILHRSRLAHTSTPRTHLDSPWLTLSSPLLPCQPRLPRLDWTVLHLHSLLSLLSTADQALLVNPSIFPCFAPTRPYRHLSTPPRRAPAQLRSFPGLGTKRNVQARSLPSWFLTLVYRLPLRASLTANSSSNLPTSKSTVLTLTGMACSAHRSRSSNK